MVDFFHNLYCAPGRDPCFYSDRQHFYSDRRYLAASGIHGFERLCDELLLAADRCRPRGLYTGGRIDRKSTRLNSSHVAISYAVFCLKKKNETIITALLY